MLQRAKLTNGLNLVLAERHAIPVVEFNLQVNAGYASDQFATPGTARLAMSMLDEGTSRRSALQISDELARLGANLGTGSGLDSSGVSLSALTATLDPALDIYADVILNPSFPEADFNRLQEAAFGRNPAGENRSDQHGACGCFPDSSTAAATPMAIRSPAPARRPQLPS